MVDCRTNGGANHFFFSLFLSFFLSFYPSISLSLSRQTNRSLQPELPVISTECYGMQICWASCLQRKPDESIGFEGDTITSFVISIIISNDILLTTIIFNYKINKLKGRKKIFIYCIELIVCASHITSKQANILICYISFIQKVI